MQVVPEAGKTLYLGNKKTSSSMRQSDHISRTDHHELDPMPQMDNINIIL